MITGRRLLVPLVVLLLCALAAPALATLRVRNDGAGLFVQDMTGECDDVRILGTNEAERNGYGDEYVYNITASGCNAIGPVDGDCTRGVGIDNGEVLCERNQPVVKVALGFGDDRLTMDSSHERGPANPPPPLGNYLVTGGPGVDNLRGHPGSDDIAGDDGNDVIRGVAGDDVLRGFDGNDSLIGGLGDDVLRGGDGNDFLGSKEPDGTQAISDGVECGSGSDTVEADLMDVIFSNCEVIDRSPVGETPHVRLPRRSLRVSRSGAVSVRLSCPREVERLGCRGRLSLRLDARRGVRSSRSNTVRYGIRAGRSQTVRLRLAAKDVRTLRQRERHGRKTHGVLRSVEQGRIGPKTTIRNPQLRLRSR